MGVTPASRRKRKTEPVHGGFREGAGRKSLFPGKRNKITIKLTDVAKAAAHETADRLTASKPRIATADVVDDVTFSDAVEYLIRKGTGTPLDA